MFPEPLVVARKDYECSICTTKIKIGDSYQRRKIDSLRNGSKEHHICVACYHDDIYGDIHNFCLEEALGSYVNMVVAILWAVTVTKDYDLCTGSDADFELLLSAKSLLDRCKQAASNRS